MKRMRSKFMLPMKVKEVRQVNLRREKRERSKVRLDLTRSSIASYPGSMSIVLYIIVSLKIITITTRVSIHAYTYNVN